MINNFAFSSILHSKRGKLPPKPWPLQNSSAAHSWVTTHQLICQTFSSHHHLHPAYYVNWKMLTWMKNCLMLTVAELAQLLLALLLPPGSRCQWRMPSIGTCYRLPTLNPIITSLPFSHLSTFPSVFQWLSLYFSFYFLFDSPLSPSLPHHCVAGCGEWWWRRRLLEGGGVRDGRCKRSLWIRI